MKEFSARQEEIIEAACALIERQGIEHLTIKNLASAIGVSEPALYRYFPSKREILKGIVERLVRSREDIWASVRGGFAGPLERLLAFFSEQASRFEERPSLSIALFSEDIFRNDADLLDRVQSLMEETRASVESLIREAQAARMLREEMDCRTVSLLILGGFRVLVSAWRGERRRKEGGDESGSLSASVETFFQNTIVILAR